MPPPAPEASQRPGSPAAAGNSKAQSNDPKTANISEKALHSQAAVRNYDDQKLITRIHGKYYDLTSFKHPGGPLALATIDNRDGTELFESHHIFTDKNVKQILEKYEIGENPPAGTEEIQMNNVYDWEATLKDPFTKELKEIARKVIGKDIKMTLGRTIQIAILCLITIH